MNAKPFVYNLDRDASDAIRGFVYQVEVTIGRWLQLTAEQTLQLEAGEDIDLVNDATGRLLIQVKDLQSAVTLTSTRGFLANCYSHIKANREHSLSFLFCTTAKAGTEQSGGFSRPGIEIWNELRGSPSGARESDLAALKTFLQGLSTPNGYSALGWGAFTDFLGTLSPHTFHDFVGAVEYSVGFSDLARISDENRAALASRSAYPETVPAAHERLFYHVFRVLASREPKELTRASLDGALVSQPNECERAENEDMRRQLLTLGVRIEGLEARVRALEEGTGSWELIRAHAAQRAESAHRSPSVRSTDVRRSGLVARAERILENHSWLAISGSRGEGKSSLAAQLAQGVETESFSIGATVSGSIETLDALRTVWGDAPGTNWHAAISRLGHCKLLILEDVPTFFDQELIVRLEAISGACSRLGKKLITTSSQKLPPQHQFDLAKNLEMRPFDNVEVANALVASGCPGTLLTAQFINAVRGVTRGHPELVEIARAFMASLDWEVTAGQVFGLIGTAVQEEITDEVRFQTTGLSEQSKSLLTRLAVPFGSYSRSIANRLADISPAIGGSRAAFSSLRGDWVNELSLDRFVTSPKAAGLSLDLDESLRAACHLAVADETLAPSLTPVKYFECITHYFSGHAPGKALTLTLLGFRQAMEAKTGEAADFLSMLLAIRVPPSTETLLKFTVKAEGVKALRRLGRDYSLEIDELVVMAEDDSEEARKGCLYTFSALADSKLYGLDFTFYAKLLGKGLRSSLYIDAGSEARPLLFLSLSNIRTARDVELLSGLLRLVRPEELERLFNGDFAQMTVLAFEQFWFAEAEKEIDSQNWARVIAVAEALSNLGREFGWDLLEGIAERVRCIVRAEYLLEPEQAITEGLAWVSERAGPLGKYLVSVNIGTQYVLIGKNGLADELLGPLLKSPQPLLPRETYLATLAYARSIYQDRLVEAAELLDSAHAIAADRDIFADSDRMRVAGERAVLNWKRGGLCRALPAVNSAARILFESDISRPSLMGQAVVFGSMVKYMQIAHEDPEALPLENDGSLLPAPRPGIFGGGEENANLFKYEQFLAFPWMLFESALACGDLAAAHEWLNTGYDKVSNAGLRVLKAMFSGPKAIESIEQLDFDAGLAQMYEAATVIPAAVLAEHSIWDPSDFDANSILNRNPDTKAMAEKRAAVWFALSTAISIARAGVRGAEAGLRSKAARAIASSFLATDETLSEYAQMLVESDPDALAARVARYRSDHPEILACGYLLASAIPGISSTQALSLHKATVRLIIMDLRPTFTGIDLFNSFIEEYWLGADSEFALKDRTRLSDFLQKMNPADRSARAQTILDLVAAEIAGSP